MTKNKQESPNVHLSQLVGIYDAVEAELVRNTLKDHGISCAIEGEHQAGFTGTLQIGILVKEADLDEARRVLKVHHPHLV